MALRCVLELTINTDAVFCGQALMTQTLFRRKEPIIAIGGGVCLDVAGLTANLYRRNTPVIKVILLIEATAVLLPCTSSLHSRMISPV